MPRSVVGRRDEESATDRMIESFAVPLTPYQSFRWKIVDFGSSSVEPNLFNTSSYPSHPKSMKKGEVPKDHVMTYLGKVVHKDKVTRLGGHYFEIGVDVVQIGGDWVTYDKKSIVWDEAINGYNYISNCVKILTDVKGSEKVYSYYSSSRISLDEYVFVIVPYDNVYAASEEVAEKAGYHKSSLLGLWFSNIDGLRREESRYLESDSFKRSYTERYMRNKTFDKVCPFAIEGIEGKKLRLTYGVESPTFIKTEGLRYKFGVELETASGILPTWAYTKKCLNLKATTDGSISGPEYVTGVLQGDYGFLNLHKICTELSRNHTVDKRCGLHVHVGHTYFTKEFSVFAYLLGLKVQNELFSILPPSRRNNEYCQMLEDRGYAAYFNMFEYEDAIAESYAKLWNYLSGGGILDKSHNKYHEHPRGRYCGGHSSARYKWLNLVPTNFNARKVRLPQSDKLVVDDNHTIEFRCHSGTLNYRKVQNWVLLCQAFVYYVDNHQREILTKETITLEDLIKAAYPKRGHLLLKYVEERKQLFNSSYSENMEYEKDSNVDSCTSLKQVILE